MFRKNDKRKLLASLKRLFLWPNLDFLLVSQMKRNYICLIFILRLGLAEKPRRKQVVFVLEGPTAQTSFQMEECREGKHRGTTTF